MSQEENKARIRWVFEEVFNQGQLAAIDEVAAPDFVDHTPLPGQPAGSAGFRHIYTFLRTAYPDLHFTVEDLLAEGDKVAIRWIMRGTQTGELLGRPPTGQPHTEHAIVIFRLVGGKVVERWAAFVPEQLAAGEQGR